MSKKSQPRIVCIGSNLESEAVLKSLLAAGANVVGLVTRPAGNGHGVCDYVDLHALCEEHGVASIDTIDINSSETVAALREQRADYVYTLGWSQLFRTEVLGLATRSVIGSHPTALPEGRGRAPIPWTVLEGRTSSAVSLFEMNDGADEGRLLVQEHFEIPECAHSGQVYELATRALCKAFLKLHELHRSGCDVVAIEQDERLATHRAKRAPADGHIDFNCGADEIERLVRAVAQPYPGSYAYYRNQKITIWRSSTAGTPAYKGVPGQVLARESDRLLVQTGDDPLWIWDFEVDGQRVGVSRFSIGSCFGYRVQDELHALRKEVADLREMLTQMAPSRRTHREVA